MIEASALSKTYRSIRALDGFDFRTENGSVTALLGRNGAGKITTFRILYTAMKPDSGVARIDGYDTVADRRVVQRFISALADIRDCRFAHKSTVS